MNDNQKAKAAEAAKINAEYATRKAIISREDADNNWPGSARQDLLEAQRYLAIAEAFAEAAGENSVSGEAAKLATISAAGWVYAAQRDCEACEKRALQKQAQEAIKQLQEAE